MGQRLMHRAPWPRLAHLLGAAAGLLAGLLFPASARAEPAHTRLVWRAAPGCISAAEVERGVAQRLGRPAFRAPPDLVLRGTLTSAAAGARAELELRTMGLAAGQHGVLVGRRVLSMPGADCRQLDQALLLVASLMLDVPREELPPPPPGPAESAARAPTERAQAVTPLGTPLRLPEPPPPTTPWGYALYAAGSAGAGLMPLPAFGAELGVVLTPPSFWAVDSGLLFQHGQLSEGSAGLRLNALAWGIAACPLHAELELCALQRVGVTWVSGAGLDENRSTRRIRAEVGAAVRYQIAFSRAQPGTAGPALSAVVGLEGVVPLVQDRYVYQQARSGELGALELFKVAPAAGRLSLGLRLKL